jgi:tetratricopeptide (TPR) repeat protein
MRIYPALLALTPALLAQDPDPAALMNKCGSQIQWMADIETPRDRQRGTRDGPDRARLLQQALERARESNRLVLWYVYGVDGRHMYRYPVVEVYAQTALWTDPDLVDLVNRKFVPLRMHADVKTGEGLQVKALGFVEPGVVILSPDGRVVHKIDRIRTFNAEWLLHSLAGVLAKHAKYAAPRVGDLRERARKDRAAALELAREYILGGDYGLAAELLEKHADSAEALYLVGMLSRRLRDPDSALQALDRARALSPGAAVRGDIEAETALVKLRARDLAGAAAAYDAALAKHPASTRTPEIKYLRAAVAFLQKREEDAFQGWESLTRDHPDSPWAWRAAANVVRGRDTTPEGPTPHAFEDFSWPAADTARFLPTDTRWERSVKDVDDIARRAVEWLLTNQRSDGSWSDARYAFWPNPSILPNVRIAATSLALTALLEWRDAAAAPDRVSAALEAGEKYILDASNFAERTNEEIYAHSYRLIYLARKAAARPGSKADAVKAMNESVAILEARQNQNGFWAHEYPNAFCTATVVHALHAARGAGATVQEALFARAAAALKSIRGADGGYAYSAGRRPSGLKDSAGRMPYCEGALLVAGEGSKAAVEKAMDNFWTHYERLERVRKCDFHSDGELGGFFFFNDVFHSIWAASLLDAKSRDRHYRRFLEELVKLPEIDGSFVDSHELGKSYATATALLCLRAVK